MTILPFKLPTLPQTPGQLSQWSSLPGASLSLVLSAVLAEHRHPVLILAQDSMMAMRLDRELRFFQQGAAQLLFFPDRETLPYDRFSPHQDLISERLSTLYKTASLHQGGVIT